MTLNEYENIAIRMIIKHGRRYMLNDSECIGQVMTALMRGFTTYDETKGTKLKTHMYNCAYRDILKILHKKPDKSSTYPDTFIGQHSDRVNNTLEYKEILEIVEKEDLLSKAEKEAFLMKYVDMMNNVQIAKEIGISNEAVRQRLSTGLKKLRSRFSEAYSLRLLNKGQKPLFPDEPESTEPEL